LPCSVEIREIVGDVVLQLFKGTFYFCDSGGADLAGVLNKTDCLNKGPPYRWVNRKYNFDNLGQVCFSFAIKSVTFTRSLSLNFSALFACRFPHFFIYLSFYVTVFSGAYFVLNFIIKQIRYNNT